MNGKIACLPKAIREQLNRWLNDGKPRQSLLVWLNPLPEVQSVPATHFAGQSVITPPGPKTDENALI